MSGDVMVFGGINMDLVVETPRLPRPGETVEGSRFATTPGGKGANQAVAAARALDGARNVHMVGRVGDDAYGQELRQLLADDEIKIDATAVDSGEDSGIAVIFVDRDGQNTVTAVYGANLKCGQEEVDAVAACAPGAAVLLVQQEIPLETTRAALVAAREHGVTTVLDPAPARPDGVELLPYVDLVTPNQTEAEALSGVAVTSVADAADATAALRSQGAAGVILTLGEMGCFVDAQGVKGHFRALPAEVVSTLAAGDAFNGGVAAALAAGAGLREAVQTGLAASALCIERAGAQAAMPRRAEIAKRIEAVPGA